MGWKIVRDKDPEVCQALGVSGEWRLSADPIAGLTKKLFEEAAEFAENRDPEELYDLEEVILELRQRLDPENVAWKRYLPKVVERGGFSKAIEWCPVPAKD